MKDIKDLLKDADVSQYRAIPFWSWNDKLEPEELKEQIKWMKDSGFGGYFMHARGGLKTEYLSDEWFDCIKTCLDAGDKCEMDSWAYDENGWPSGFVGGKLLEDAENCDRYLTYDIGKFNPDAMVSYLLTDDKILRTTESGKGEYLNVYQHYSNSTADILNPEVVKKFIAMTHEEYKKRMGERFSSLKGFFTDEPQYYRWAHPYTKTLPAYFAEVYGEDILDRLGLMFVEKEGYRDFRYKYWLAMQTLMLNGFAKHVYGWCDENGLLLTGHYVEEGSLQYQMCCCGGIMPFYEYEHIPGVDHLGPNVRGNAAPKQVSSVARQLGKKRVLTETFACCGWGVTAKQTKRIAEWQFVNGVNLICQHLLPYSEHGQRKRDYPAHYSWANPWVRENYKPFNDFFANLGYLLGESSENVSVAVFVPIRSMYFDYKRETFGRDNYEINDSYQELINKLSAMNVPFHLADETVMEKHASVNGKKLVIGNCSYDYVVFPKTYTMGKFSKKLFEDFYAAGGKILFTDSVPEYVEGQPAKYALATNTDLGEIVSAQEYTVDNFDTQINSTFREFDGKKFIYAVNLSDDKDYTVTFSGNFKSFVSYDLESGKTSAISNKVHFDAGQSYVLFLSDESVDYVEPIKELVLDGPYNVVESSDNYLTLDKLQYSLDGINYSPVLRYMGVFNELLNKRYSGAVYLKYSFDVKAVPQKIYFLSEDMHNEWCEVNGQRVEFAGSSDFEKKVYKADISRCVKKGVNQAVIKIDFYESDSVYYVLFGDVVGESLKNCLAYDTTIEPCYLQGDFCVYSERGFVKGQKPEVLLSDGFYIAEKKAVISDTVKDGYPFFSGKITLEKKFESDGKPIALKLNGNFCLCEIEVNGKKVEKSYFADKVDISGYAVQGENTVRVTLWSGNRNLMGPHHYLDDEDPPVGPYTFELLGTWVNGVSSKERENYAFVRFGLFND